MGMSQYFAYNNYKVRSKKLQFVLVHIYSRISRMHGLVWIYRKVEYKSTKTHRNLIGICIGSFITKISHRIQAVFEMQRSLPLE